LLRRDLRISHPWSKLDPKTDLRAGFDIGGGQMNSAQMKVVETAG
jgi:hypothetical protein